MNNHSGQHGKADGDDRMNDEPNQPARSRGTDASELALIRSIKYSYVR